MKRFIDTTFLGIIVIVVIAPISSGIISDLVKSGTIYKAVTNSLDFVGASIYWILCQAPGSSSGFRLIVIINWIDISRMDTASEFII